VFDCKEEAVKATGEISEGLRVNMLGSKKSSKKSKLSSNESNNSEQGSSDVKSEKIPGSKKSSKKSKLSSNESNNSEQGSSDVKSEKIPSYSTLSSSSSSSSSSSFSSSTFPSSRLGPGSIQGGFGVKKTSLLHEDYESQTLARLLSAHRKQQDQPISV